MHVELAKHLFYAIKNGYKKFFVSRKKATPGGAARDIESIWEERYSTVQSSGGYEPCSAIEARFAALPQLTMLQCSYARIAYMSICIFFVHNCRPLGKFLT